MTTTSTTTSTTTATMSPDLRTCPSADAAREQALELCVVRVRQVMRDFSRAAVELDLTAAEEELRGDATAALLDRAHAKQMRLCNVRLASALQLAP